MITATMTEGTVNKVFAAISSARVGVLFLLLIVACNNVVIRAGQQGERVCDANGMNCICSPEESATSADNFCGGGDDSDDVWTQAICTPYAYNPKSYNVNNGFTDTNSCNCAPNCDEPYLDVLSYGSGYASAKDGYDYTDTNVWAADPDPNNWWIPEGGSDTTSQDYFVFHGCDGAGTQSDCAGDIRYIERIQGLYSDNNLGIVNGKGTMPNDGICSGVSGDDRRYCKFVHPGTMTIHENYMGGWWADPTNDGLTCDPAFGDEGSGCIYSGVCVSLASGAWDAPLCDNILSIPNNYFNGQHPFADVDGYHFSFVLYPWRCGPNGDDTNNLFSYPSIATNGNKCYVDNEPNPAPLGIEIYFGVLISDNTEIKLYRFDSDSNYNVNFANKDNPYSIYNVNQGKANSGKSEVDENGAIFDNGSTNSSSTKVCVTKFYLAVTLLAYIGFTAIHM